MLVQTPEAMKERFNIDVRVQNEVLKINREDKNVEVKNLATNEVYLESYDELVLSPGSTPLKPPIPGIDSPNIFTLWNIPDTDAIKSFVDNNKPKRAVVVGGGFIGIEMVENLHDLGLEVSLVEMMDQVMTPVDFEMAQSIHQHLGQKGVKLHLSNGVKSFKYKNNVTTVTLQSGLTIEADVVMLSIGVRPQSNLAKEAGLELNQRGGIVVDSRLKTKDSSIYAIGDAIEVVDFVSGNKAMVPLAGPANKQGRIVANLIAGVDDEYKGTQGTSIAKVFDLTVATTGLNEKQLKQQGLEYKKDYHVSIIHSKSHAGYYPGAIPMALKLIFKTDGKILGAQIVGYDGVDKRIDVIATALRFGGTIYDLTELELAYAPPYSSAKDPVNMVGYTAENILKNKMAVVSWHEIQEVDDQKTVILDVREPLERDLGYIEGSVNIPVDDLRERHVELDKNKEIIVYCAIGLRGYVAGRILMQHGFKNVKNLSGGYSTYACVSSVDGSGQCSDVACNTNPHISDSGDAEDLEFDTGTGNVFKLNACGLQCPGPIMQVHNKLEEMARGDILEVRATDPGFVNDIGVWTKRTENTLIESGKREKEFYAVIKKGTSQLTTLPTEKRPTGKNMVVFSGDLDKAIASFIIANGAAAMGREVTMFFTFWGLNIIRKHEKVSATKDFMGRMFSGMMPRGSRRLGLSKMNMMGMGPKMIRMVMKNHNVDSLEDLIKMAQENGVKMVACNMSMDLMGITESEIVEGVEYGGVATFLGAAEESDMSLFI